MGGSWPPISEEDPSILTPWYSIQVWSFCLGLWEAGGVGGENGDPPPARWKGKELALSFPPRPCHSQAWRAGRIYGWLVVSQAGEPCQGGPDGGGGRHRSARMARAINNASGCAAALQAYFIALESPGCATSLAFGLKVLIDSLAQ